MRARVRSFTPSCVAGEVVLVGRGCGRGGWVGVGCYRLPAPVGSVGSGPVVLLGGLLGVLLGGGCRFLVSVGCGGGFGVRLLLGRRFAVSVGVQCRSRFLLGASRFLVPVGVRCRFLVWAGRRPRFVQGCHGRWCRVKGAPSSRRLRRWPAATLDSTASTAKRAVERGRKVNPGSFGWWVACRLRPPVCWLPRLLASAVLASGVLAAACVGCRVCCFRRVGRRVCLVLVCRVPVCGGARVSGSGCAVWSSRRGSYFL
jgi:hypothetical protein